MYPVSVPSVILPVGVAVITTTAGLLYCCAKRMVSKAATTQKVEGNAKILAVQCLQTPIAGMQEKVSPQPFAPLSKDPIEEKIQRIDALAKIILNNPGWWKIEGPFRISGEEGDVSAGIEAFEKAEPFDFQDVFSTLQKESRFTSGYEPTHILKKMVRKLIDSSSIQVEELKIRTPFFNRLVNEIIEQKEVTKMGPEALEIVLLQKKCAQDDAIERLRQLQLSQSGPRRLSQSAPSSNDKNKWKGKIGTFFRKFKFHKSSKSLKT